MMIQHGKTHLLQRAFVRRRGPGVLNHPVRVAFAVTHGLTKKDHRVIGKLVNPRLVEEEQVASLGAATVAADEDAVEILQGARVCELRELAAREVALLKRPEVRAKEFFAERIRVEVEDRKSV